MSNSHQGALLGPVAAIAPVLAVTHKNLAVAITARGGFILLVVLVIAGVTWARRRPRSGKKVPR
jgi:hypothetical protein